MPGQASDSLLNQFSDVLKISRIGILRYDPTKSKSLTLNTGSKIAPTKLLDKIRESMGPRLIEYPEVFKAGFDASILIEAIERYTEEAGTKVSQESISASIPEEYKSLRLNVDAAKGGNSMSFFLTTKEEKISEVSGQLYVKTLGLSEQDALREARHVFVEYRPRSPRGVFREVVGSGMPFGVLNRYTGMPWEEYEEPLPEELPKEFEALVRHVLPIEEERQFFYHWLHGSMFTRAMTFLVLCGIPGAGKNVLKLVMRALHGHDNSVDGKKSTLKERFNSQVADSTLLWFDELRYNEEMENVMKEIQNDSISIERKGVDATRSTRIYASIVLSNNKPRDNYITFDARKFVPLQVTPFRLEDRANGGLRKSWIDNISKWVTDPQSPDYNIAFVAQIGRWIRDNGKSDRPEWSRYEYRGPMFYKLCHTSMTRWQSRVIHTLVVQEGLGGPKIVYDRDRGYLWSSINDMITRRGSDKAIQIPEASTVRSFLDSFRGTDGEKVFETETHNGKGFTSDFYVRLLVREVDVFSEDKYAEETEQADVKKKKTDKRKSRPSEEFYDL